ncbi:MAG: DUF4190 domain-containing protein [Bacteroidota bacterium]|nr:DUF4190 domain-containing protein [Bacteroidota bacterium]
MKKIFLFTFLSSLLVFTGCTVQKRHYRNGFSVNWNDRNSAKENSKESPDQKTEATDIATLAAENSIPQSSPIDQESLVLQDTCDQIETAEGSIAAKVLEVTPESIKYQSCNDSDKSEKVIEREKVKSITYSNGTKETINKELPKKKPVQKPTPGRRKKGKKEVSDGPQEHIQAKLSWHFGIAAFVPVVGWIFALLAIIHGLIAYAKIKKHPDLYTGKTQSVVGIYLGVAGIILGIIAVILVFAVLMGVGF